MLHLRESAIRLQGYFHEAGGVLSPEWWQKRWISADVTEVPCYYNCVRVTGNTMAKPKQSDAQWRQDWLWTPLCLSGSLPQHVYVYNDNMHVQMRTLLRVDTRLVAMRVGPEAINVFGVDTNGIADELAFYNPEHEDEQFIGTKDEIEDLILTYQAGPISITYI